MMAAGVLAGALRPYTASASKPGKPDDATVGSPGKMDEGCALATAMARTLPDWMCGAAVLAVRDWIHFKLDGIIDWPIFNLADSWLVIGAGILLLISLRAPPATDEEPTP